MANSSFFLRIGKIVKLNAPKFTQAQLRAVGGVAIHELQERVDKHLNVYDAPFKPYSPKGPIYVAISGRGTMKKTYKAGAIVSNSFGMTGMVGPGGMTAWVKRNKSNLGGREIFTSKDLKQMKLAGVLVVKKGTAAVPKRGQIIARDTGKSIKFANYSDYKKAIGKSGLRDLEVSNKMRGAIAIVSITGATKCEIGFTRELEHAKAQGNQAIDPWFGLSPSNKAAILSYIDTLAPAVVSAMTAA